MRQSVVGLRGSGSDFDTYRPYVYVNSQWMPCTVKVYDGGWHEMGDTLYLVLRDSNAKDMTDSAGKTIQVRKDIL